MAWKDYVGSSTDELINKDPEQIKEVANVLRENIGKIVKISYYSNIGPIVEEGKFKDEYAVVEKVYYDGESNVGRVDAAYFRGNIPSEQNDNIGFIFSINDKQGNNLYSREETKEKNR